MSKCGTLYVVATPIGNLQDISLRAIEILKAVDLIAAEDTRHSATLLKHFSIEKPTISCHEWNERKQIPHLIQQLQAGKSIALISDAGTPLISDPGYNLINAAYAEDVKVVPIPGACAAIVALSACPFPTDKFYFAGFLPSKKQACLEVLKQFANSPQTVIFYETPHRIQQTLALMKEIFSDDRQIAIARELTKMHETIKVGSVIEITEYFLKHKEKLKGEFVLLIAPDISAAPNDFELERVLSILLSELPLKQAVALTSKITGERKNIIYNIALNEKQKNIE